MNNKNFLKYDTNRSFHSLYEVKRRKFLKMVDIPAISGQCCMKQKNICFLQQMSRCKTVIKWKKEIVLIIFINA
ncbi:hypothetical protein DXA96_04360 [Lachnospiraceae bacterium OF09-33XD]|nr:hypothetical protein DXA96_04360 [Lachnospiraceae bacterium OF09-33XD]